MKLLHACAAALSVAAPAGALELSLEQALSRAEAESPLVRRAHQAGQVVAALRTGAGLRFPANPAAAVTLGNRSDTSGSVPPSRGFEWGVHLEQTVEVAGQRGTRLAEVDRAIRAAGARERLARAETRARVRAAYVGSLIAKSQLASAQEREELAERVLSSARARVQAGAASDVEAHLAEAEWGRVRHERMEAELASADAAGELRRVLDLPADLPLALTSPLQPPSLPARALELLLDEARARREELRLLDSVRSQLDAAIVRLRREIVPSPTFFLDVQRQQPGQTYIGAGLGLALPLWRRNQGELAVVRAEQARAEEETAIVQREIAAEVSRLHRVSFSRRDEARLWTERIVPAAQANVELVTQGWHAGKFDLFRVVQVAREAGEARRKELEILGALWQSVIELDRAVGAP